MKINFEYINISYNKEKILDIIPQAPGYSYCDKSQIDQIKKLLGIKIPVISILYFNLDPNTLGIIHKDVIADNNQEILYALNLPLKNCEETYMNWFQEIKKGHITHFSGPSTGSKTPKLERDSALVVEHARCNQPIFVKINDWHSIDNRSMNYNSIISLRFEKIFSQEFVKEYFGRECGTRTH